MSHFNFQSRLQLVIHDELVVHIIILMACICCKVAELCLYDATEHL